MADPADRRRLGSLFTNPDLDRWVTLTADERVVVRTGKAELGQGIRTAIAAVAADELGVDPSRIAVEGAATGTSPNEGVTAGSGSVEQSVTAARQACAHARRLLFAKAAVHLGADAGDLTVDDGRIAAPSGATVTYWQLHGGKSFDYQVDAPVALVDRASRRYTGHGLTRVDLPDKIRGEPAFVHDLRLPGMRHARVIRPARPGAVLTGEVPAPAAADIVRKGSFLAVVADREAEAVRAAEWLAARLEWAGGSPPAAGSDHADYLEDHVDDVTLIVDGSPVDDPPPPPLDLSGARTFVAARYSKPFLLHGSIGPSAAVAWLDGGHLRVWSHSQGVEVLRLSLSPVVDLPADAITVTHVDGAGCYGHNGADDAGLDAALVAMALPGTPVSVKWTRADEHGWEPASTAMAVRLQGGVGADGCLVGWQHDLYTYAHGSRPRPARPGMSGLLASWYLDPPLERPPSQPSRGFHGGGHRNADPIYEVGERRIVKHFLRTAPVRTSSTRSLGAFANVFAIESFMDELAAAAGVDPVAFRLAHLSDPRAREVIEAAVDLAGGLHAPGGLDAPGRGIAFARYENIKAYAAVVAEVEVVARTGEIRFTRAWIAADAGEVIDPDGLANQLEGGVVQAASWTLKERVGLGPDGITTRDWSSYPILRFSETPVVTTRLLDRSDQRPLGAGEATAGPTAAALANAVYQATGARLRDLPLTPDKVRPALRALL